MSRVEALVLAAGRGTRMGSEIPKQLMDLNGQALFLYAVKAFRPLVDRVTVVTGAQDVEKVEEALKASGITDVPVIVGGETRTDSGFNGLKFIEDAKPDIVLIHDAARALITKEIIENCIEDVKRFGSSVVAIPSKDTVKVVNDMTVQNTPDRSTLYCVQTPQGFTYSLLSEAYKKAYETGQFTGLTDDASVVEKMTEHPVRITLGSEENLKITTPLDLRMAEMILRSRK